MKQVIIESGFKLMVSHCIYSLLSVIKYSLPEGYMFICNHGMSFDCNT